MTELGRWFDALWADSVDVTNDVLVELQRSWAVAATPPYHVYLKALYELYKEEIDTPELEPGRRGVPELASFQLDAVRQALKMVDRHGGCFVGDVVGLGKTYIGAEIVRQLQFEQPPGRHPLIICPAGLIPMWQTVSERFGLGAEVVSMSAIVPPAGATYRRGGLASTWMSRHPSRASICWHGIQTGAWCWWTRRTTFGIPAPAATPRSPATCGTQTATWCCSAPRPRTWGQPISITSCASSWTISTTACCWSHSRFGSISPPSRQWYQ